MLITSGRQLDKFSFHKFIAKSVVRHRQQLVGSHRLGKGSAHKYSSTFPTISRIWKGRPFTFEKGTASIKYYARIIVHSWPSLISGMITVSECARTSPRYP